jgi:putative hydrolase of the HAD superfamily
LDTDLIDYIRILKQNYRTAMLTNAPSHVRIAINEEFHIADAFHLIVISAEVGLMKPDPAIYRLTLERLGFEPYEAVFIDDVSENVEGARQVGMHAILFKNTEQTRTDLQSLLDDATLELP